MDLINQGDQLVDKSNKFYIRLFSSIQNNYITEAINKYEEAGRVLLLEKKYIQSGEAYIKAAELSIISNEQSYLTSTYYQNACTSYKLAKNINMVVLCFKLMVQCTDMSPYSISRAYHDLAEAQEQLFQYQEAIESYNSAIDLYIANNTAQSAINCRKKVALLYIKLENYSNALATYESIAGDYIHQGGISRYLLPEIYLYCMLSRLISSDYDVTDAKIRLDRYSQDDVGFSGSNECGLIEKILYCIENEDIDGFTVAVQDYDGVRKLDEVKVSMLLKIKRFIRDSDLL